MLRAFAATALLLTTATTATKALAAEPTETPAAAEAPEAPEAVARSKSHDDVLITAGLGAFGDPDKAGGIVSLTGLRQKGLLGYGATFEYGGAVLDYTTVTAAPMVGIFVDGPHWLRFGIAATGGIHHYEGVGRGFLSSDPGASGTTAFIGTRVFLGAEVGGKARFHIGLQLSLDDDLTRTRYAYAYQETAWTSPHSSTAAHTVGALRVGGMLALGTAFDL